jgi:hypothetical protein
VRAFILAALSAVSGYAQAQTGPSVQWAGSVLGYSSQYSADQWSAQQALGAPDTPTYGDISTAWAPASENGGAQFISVGFAQSITASGALIREVFGNGFVVQIDAIDTLGVVHTVWSGLDSSPPGVPADFMVSWASAAYLTQGLTIHIDTAHSASFEEIDAIGLLSENVSAVPEPGSWALMSAGLCGLLLRGRLGRFRSFGRFGSLGRRDAAAGDQPS